MRWMRRVPVLRHLPLAAILGHAAILRISSRKEVVRTYFGAEIQCDPADMIQLYLQLFGVWEPDVSLAIESILSPGDVFVDVGANIGYDTLLGARKVGPAGRVVAIEASPSTFALINANVARNPDLTNVRVANVAASRTEGTLELYEGGKGNIGAATTVATRGGQHLFTVPARPLTKILSGDEARAARLMKIDVEGAEAPILHDILDNLPAFSPDLEIIVEMSSSTDDGAAVFARTAEAGFRAYGIANRYDLVWYAIWRERSPYVALTSCPAEQTDILFSRRTYPTGTV
jgi:FkbM family methyltransferase